MIRNSIITKAATIAVVVIMSLGSMTASAAEPVTTITNHGITFTKAEGTTVYSASYAPNWYVKETITAYNKMPDNVKNSLSRTGTNFYIVNNADSSTFTGVANPALEIRGRTVTATSGKSVTTYILLFADSTLHTTQESLIFHETGHYINRYCVAGTLLSESDEFVNLMQTYGPALKTLAWNTTGSVMDGSNTKKARSEMYAECFTLYLMYPNELAKTAPEMYNYIAGTSASLQ